MMPNKVNISEKLRAFLAAYLEWAEQDQDPRRIEKNKDIFTRRSGLCLNAHYFDIKGPSDLPFQDIECELKYVFWDLGLCQAYPFGMDQYDEEYAESQHTDPVRLDWVRCALEGRLDEWSLPIDRGI